MLLKANRNSLSDCTSSAVKSHELSLSVTNELCDRVPEDIIVDL